MAIYRPPRPRWPALAAVLLVGLLIGGIAGWALRGGGEDDVSGLVERLDDSLTDAASLLEVAAVEYKQAAGGSDQELSGATGALERSQTHYEVVAEVVRRLAADRAEAIEDAYRSIFAQMNASVPATEVEAALDALELLLAPG